MRRFSNVLLVLHGHCDRAGALDWAASVARWNQAALHVLEVLEPLPRDIRTRIDLMRPIMRGDPERSALRKSGARLREEVAAIRGQGISGGTKAVLGFPSQVIVDESRQTGCDLVILTAERSRGLSQWLFGGTSTAGLVGGSTTDKLLRRLDCSLLILHPGEAVSQFAGAPNGLGRQLNG